MKEPNIRLRFTSQSIHTKGALDRVSGMTDDDCSVEVLVLQTKGDVASGCRALKVPQRISDECLVNNATDVESNLAL